MSEVSPLRSFTFSYEGREYSALGQKINSQIWVYFEGQTHVISTLDDSKRGKKRGASAGRSSNDIAAPMPGKITKVLCKEGQNLEPGQVVIIMEAMKMEYTLKSDIRGTVKTVKAKVGDQVTLGQILAELEPMPTEAEKIP